MLRWLRRRNGKEALDDFEEEQLMRKYFIAIVAVAALGIAKPAMAYHSAG